MNQLFASFEDAMQCAYELSKQTGQVYYRHETETKYGNRRWLVSLISDPVIAEIEYLLKQEQS